MRPAVNSSRVGARVESDGHYGTVRFIGEVPPTKGTWFGIEWDDPTRGKHDGSHQGKRYFTTKHETSGSFLRPQKANLGVLFVPALRERYGRVEAEGAGIIQEEMYIRGNRSQQTAVEMVGAEKVNKQQSHLDRLLDVCLHQLLISGAGLDGQIAAICPRIQNLDISRNLIPSWCEIARILHQLPDLSGLRVSENRLSLPTDDNEDFHGAFPGIKSVFANRMGYSWEQVLQCCEMWPYLEELHVCFNCISELRNPLPNLQHLTLLNLESNPIQHWEQLLALGQLPKLAMLILSDTGIEHIRFPDCPPDGTTSSFAALESLLLKNNKIADWQSISELNKLQRLHDVKFRDNPLVTADEDISEQTVRYIFIARIQRLALMNKSEVTPEERKGAERDYLKMYGAEWKASGGHQDPQQNKPSPEFAARHPRYQQLVDFYGPAEDSELVKKSTALKNSLVSLTIDCPMRPDKLPLKRKFPVSMTVQKMKAMMQRLYKADPATLSLTYTSVQAVGQEYEFDNDLREIGFYAIEDGDTVNVTWEGC